MTGASRGRRRPRVVVKVGSSSLTTAAGGIDPDRVRALVDALAGARARGAEVVLVSSGAIAAGLAPLGLARRPRDLATQQAAASVGQGLLVHRYTEEFARHGIIAGQVLLTVDDVTRRSHYRNAYRTFAKLLELGVLPIVNENDTVATTRDPVRRQRPARRAGRPPGARRPAGAAQRRRRALRRRPAPTAAAALLAEVASPSRPRRRAASAAPARPGVGTGGMQTKVEAARIATGAGIPVVLTSADQAGGGAGRRAGRHRCSTRPAGAGPPGCCGWPTPPSRKGRLAARRRRRPRGHRAPGLAAARRDHRRDAAPSSAGDPVDLVGPDGVAGGPRAGQLRRRRAARRCSAGPPATWPASWARPTSARSCTATTWSCFPALSRPVDARSAAGAVISGEARRRGLAQSAEHWGRRPDGTPARAAPVGHDRDFSGTGEGVASVSELARLWHVTVTVAGDEVEPLIVRNALRRLNDQRPFLHSLKYAGGRAEIQYWEEAESLLDASSLALRVWNEHRESAGLPRWEVVGLEVLERAGLPVPRHGVPRDRRPPRRDTAAVLRRPACWPPGRLAGA